MKKFILYIAICISFYLFVRLVFGDISSRNAKGSEDILAKAERYFDSLKATKQIHEVSQLNDTTKFIESSSFEVILKDFSRNIDTVDDFVRHFDDFAPIYKAAMTPRSYEVATKFMSKLKGGANLANVNIMKEIDGVPYFLKLPKEMDFNWIVFQLWFKMQDEATQIKTLERLDAKPSAIKKARDTSVKTVKE